MLEGEEEELVDDVTCNSIGRFVCGFDIVGGLDDIKIWVEIMTITWEWQTSTHTNTHTHTQETRRWFTLKFLSDRQTAEHRLHNTSR
jgi:hypothetical protein